MADDCAICAKHRGEGPLKGELVGRTAAFWVYHAPPGDDGLASLGHLLVESDRHASDDAAPRASVDDVRRLAGRLRQCLA